MGDRWREVTLGEIAEIVIGRTPPRDKLEYWTDNMDRPFCTIADMTDATVIPRREGVTTLAELEGKARRVPAGSLLMSFKLTLGRVGFAGLDLFPNEAIAWLRCTVPDVCDRYLALWLSALDMDEFAGRAVKGKTLNGSSLRALPVSFPPLDEQRRIVDLIAAVDENADAKRVIAQTARASLIALLEGGFAALWRECQGVPLGDYLSRVRRPVEVKADEMYRQIGVRSHGRGLFYKDPVPGSELGSKKVFWIEPGDLVFNIVFAWEGAVAVATSSEKGWCGSHRFPTYRSSRHVDVNFFRHCFRTKRGVELLGLASPGSAGRNRTLNQQMLMDFAVPLPSVAETINLVNVLGAAEAVVEEADRSLEAALSLRIALLDDLLSGRHTIPSSYDELLST
jgi:restriction endonuclease S subunit